MDDLEQAKATFEERRRIEKDYADLAKEIFKEFGLKIKHKKDNFITGIKSLHFKIDIRLSYNRNHIVMLYKATSKGGYAYISHDEARKVASHKPYTNPCFHVLYQNIDDPRIRVKAKKELRTVISKMENVCRIYTSEEIKKNRKKKSDRWKQLKRLDQVSLDRDPLRVHKIAPILYGRGGELGDPDTELKIKADIWATNFIRKKFWPRCEIDLDKETIIDEKGKPLNVGNPEDVFKLLTKAFGGKNA